MPPFTLKAYRTGRATELAVKGAPLGEISRPGKWKSKAVLAYINEDALDTAEFIQAFDSDDEQLVRIVCFPHFPSSPSCACGAPYSFRFDFVGARLLCVVFFLIGRANYWVGVSLETIPFRYCGDTGAYWDVS